MPRRDIYHECVKAALEKDGWIITDDPLRLDWNEAIYYPDIGAERVIAAIKGTQKIAVEIKTFISPVLQEEFYKALGQFDNYFFALQDLEPDRHLVLAIPVEAHEGFFQKAFVQTIIQKKRITLLVYNIEKQSIEKWIN